MKIFLSLALVAPLALFWSCDEKTAPPEIVEKPKTQQECTDRNGRWAIGGILGAYQCFLPTPDAGKKCNKSTDCTAACMADTRTCQAETPLFGCFEYLDENGQMIGICVD